jgi:hypothetical protein
VDPIHFFDQHGNSALANVERERKLNAAVAENEKLKRMLRHQAQKQAPPDTPPDQKPALH